MMTLSAGIVTVPSRLSMALSLQKKLGSFSNVCLDSKLQGSWYGTRKAWEYGLKQGTTHIMAIEDDVDVCQNFYDTTMLAIGQHPDQVISFYSIASDRHFCAWATKNESSWYKLNDVPSGQCVIMPRLMVLRFLMFCDRYVAMEGKYEDMRLWGFMYFNKLSAYVVVPNLVQHMAPMQSTLGFNNKGKVSPCFIGRDVSGTVVDFAKDKTNEKSFGYSNSMSRGDSFFKAFLGTREMIEARSLDA